MDMTLAFIMKIILDLLNMEKNLCLYGGLNENDLTGSYV